MDDHKFFRAVWRFNALALAVGVVLVSVLALVAVAEMASRSLWREARDVAAPTSGADAIGADEAKLSIGHFSWLSKGRTLWAPVHGAQTFQYRLSSKTASSVRNYVFLDAQTASSHTLLPEYTFLIAATHVIYNSAAQAQRTPLAVALAIVETDSNSDQRLSGRDLAVIALARPDGKGVVRLPVRGQLIAAHSVDQRNGLLVIETAKADVQVVRVDLETFKVLSQSPVWRDQR